MTIGKTSPRVDLTELGHARRSASSILDHLLLRSDQAVEVDPGAFHESEALEGRVRSLHNHATLYQRDTGINGLYLGFPFVMVGNSKTRLPRIAPVLLWPVGVRPEIGSVGQVVLSFDRDREEVRLNPAFDSLFGPEITRRWQETARELIARSTIRAVDVMDAFGTLASAQGRMLVPLPGRDSKVPPGEVKLTCSAVLFHLVYSGQAVAEDLRLLRGKPVAGTSLETALRVTEPTSRGPLTTVSESERFHISPSDPSQDAAILEARRMPGLMVEGPPGTGKSQTIVNMVADVIGRGQNLLIVCQKQAALEVVRKRLLAEGLGHRIVMITDVHREREATVRSLRQHVESLHTRPENGLATLRSRRQQLAGQISVLEADLNRHHIALHQVDPKTDLSYRHLIGDLIQLDEGPQRPLDVPALRVLLASQDPFALALIEEACGPLAQLWLSASYEDSPLEELKTFAVDDGNVAAFKRAFEDFVLSEADRSDVQSRTPLAMHTEDPEAVRSWLGKHSEMILGLSDESRQRIVRWISLFHGQSHTKGQKLIERLEGISAGLSVIPRRGIAGTCADSVRRLSDETLAKWLGVAEALSLPPSLWARLTLQHWWKQKQLRAFFELNGISESITIRSTFVECARAEMALRPWRLKLAAVLDELRSRPPDIIACSVEELVLLTEQHRTQLSGVKAVAEALQSCPNQKEAELAVQSATEAAFRDFVARAEQGCERHDARQRSLAALDGLAPWFVEEWVIARKKAVKDDGCSAVPLKRVSQSLPSLVAYQRFRVRAGVLDKQALAVFRVLRTVEPALATIPNDAIESQVRKIIRREALLGWKTRLESEQPALVYEKAELVAKIKLLAQAGKDMCDLNRRLVAEDVDRKAVAPLHRWEDITRLRGPRARRLREILDLGPDLGLMNLWPVWLMNPDVASRLLPLKTGLFDVVIYDESSQIPVEYALPTLYRSKRFIVSGDEKQMPPTAFFSSRVESDETDVFGDEELEDAGSEEERELLAEVWNRREIKDCPDLLQLAKTVLPARALQIHYRSAFRELIQFSNSAFYSNSLNIPVRQPVEEVLRNKPIEFIPVNGIYQDQTNLQEALRVVDVLAQRWKGVPRGNRPSVGIVTFNRKQADLIEETVERRAQTDAEFRDAMCEERERIEDGEDMGFFIKNVENVQGDERDVMIFSSTFGRNKQGTFRRNFGVLGQIGGERRLNVAVTRARKQVILLTSMPINEISDLLTTRRPATSPRDFLQSYIEYARAISAGELLNAETLLSRFGAERRNMTYASAAESDGVQRAVAKFIECLGWKPQRLPDGGAFSFDFVIEDPRTGLFGLAIECDAPQHPLLDSARARELWRPDIVRKSIPAIHRVSSYGWYHEGDRERRLLEEAVRRALN